MNDNDRLRFAENYWAGLAEPMSNLNTPEVFIDPTELQPVKIPPLPTRWQAGDPMRPVVAIDVDGVLNAFRRDGHYPEGYIEHETVLPMWAAARSQNLVDQGTRNLHTRISYNPKHGAWIRRLLERGVEVVWCTSWESIAPVVWSDLLDIPPLPVVVLPQQSPQKIDRETGADAKARALSQLFLRRPLVWIDDQSGRYVGRWRTAFSTRVTTVPTFVPFIDSWQGLTEETIREVDIWLVDNRSREFVLEKDCVFDVDYGSWKVVTQRGTFEYQISDDYWKTGPDYQWTEHELIKLSPALADKLGVVRGWTTEFEMSDYLTVGGNCELEIYDLADDRFPNFASVKANLGQVLSITLEEPPATGYFDHAQTELDRKLLKDGNTPETLSIPDLDKRFAIQQRAAIVAATIPGVRDVGIRDQYLEYSDDFTVARAELEERSNGFRLVVLLEWCIPNPDGPTKWTETGFADNNPPHLTSEPGILDPELALPYLVNLVRGWIRERILATNEDGA